MEHINYKEKGIETESLIVMLFNSINIIQE